MSETENLCCEGIWAVFSEVLTEVEGNEVVGNELGWDGSVLTISSDKLKRISGLPVVFLYKPHSLRIKSKQKVTERHT